MLLLFFSTFACFVCILSCIFVLVVGSFPSHLQMALFACASERDDADADKFLIDDITEYRWGNLVALSISISSFVFLVRTS